MSYEFTLVLSGLSAAENADEVAAESIYAAGIDCLVSSNETTLTVDYLLDEGNSLSEVILSAVRELESKTCYTVKSVDNGQYVSLAEAAELAGITRQTMSKYNKGSRGRGMFPSPCFRTLTKNSLWDWVEVAEWLVNNQLADPQLLEDAKAVSDINLALKLRNQHTLDNVLTIKEMLG